MSASSETAPSAVHSCKDLMSWTQSVRQAAAENIHIPFAELSKLQQTLNAGSKDPVKSNQDVMNCAEHFANAMQRVHGDGVRSRLHNLLAEHSSYSRSYDGVNAPGVARSMWGAQACDVMGEDFEKSPLKALHLFGVECDDKCIAEHDNMVSPLECHVRFMDDVWEQHAADHIDKLMKEAHANGKQGVDSTS
jgi:hypothetical protein